MKTFFLKIIFLLVIFHGSLYAQTTNELFNKKVEKYFQKLRGSSTKYLINAISRKSSSKSIKLACVKALGQNKSVKATNILTAVMSYVWKPNIYEKKFNKGEKAIGITISFDDDIRAEAAISLAKINKKSSIPYIGNTLNADRNSKVRQYSARALGMMRSRKAIPYLEKAISYELRLDRPNIDNLVVLECAKALGKIGHKDGFFSLIEITQNNKLKYETRKEALKSLEKVKWE